MVDKNEVFFMSKDVKLSGNLYLNKDDDNKKAVIILSHGLGGRKEWLDKKAIDICKGGNHVLTFDFRGHGDSEGIADRDIINDLNAAINYVRKTFSNEKHPIILGGQCMGGLFSINVSINHDDVIGVFGTSITPEWIIDEKLWKLTVKNMEEHKGGHSVNLNSDSLYEIYREFDVRESIKRLGTKSLLVIHYEDDEITPVDVAYKTFVGSSCEKNLIVLNGGQHTSPYLYNNFNDILVWWINQKKCRWCS